MLAYVGIETVRTFKSRKQRGIIAFFFFLYFAYVRDLVCAALLYILLKGVVYWAYSWVLRGDEPGKVHVWE